MAMVAYVIERLAPQVESVVINANRNLETYAEFKVPVIPDGIAGFAGPLAGLQVGMQHCLTPLLVTAPCDSPFLPLDLVARLHAPFANPAVDLTVAKTGEQAHPVFCMVKVSREPHLRAFLETGQRKIDKWYATLNIVEVRFDDEAAFTNINTRDELATFESTR